MDKTCADLVQPNFEERMRVLRDLWAMEDPDSEHEEHETNIYEFGLSFDYQPAADVRRGYWTYQLSTGGPGDEFRIYEMCHKVVGELVDEYHVSVDRIEYWFFDWFDGASIELIGDDFEWFKDFFTGFFVDSGTAFHVRRKALSD